jgi:multisubunit Na+/H+ antiporter MnhC subunit
LIPQALAGLGVVGYVVHATGSVAEVLGFPLSLYLLIPGALFEISIALWLIFKGFNAAVVSSGDAEPLTAPEAAPPVGAPVPVQA